MFQEYEKTVDFSQRHIHHFFLFSTSVAMGKSDLATATLLYHLYNSFSHYKRKWKRKDSLKMISQKAKVKCNSTFLFCAAHPENDSNYSQAFQFKQD